MDIADRAGCSLTSLFEAARTTGFAGPNVTYPFKQAAINLLGRIDPQAAQTGAANTVVFAANGASTGYDETYAGQWAADVIDTPVETAFIRAAAARGARTLTGGGVCVHQAAEALRLFSVVDPDLPRMQRACGKAHAARDTKLTATKT